MSTPEQTVGPQQGRQILGADGRAATTSSLLALPDISGMTLSEAALTFALGGWYVLPVRPGSKRPGTVVGDDWPAKSSRDPDQIRRWWGQNPNYGIALHVGRSGAVAFDLDIETLVIIADAGLPEVAEALQSAGGINGTRPEGDRGHYLFLVPEGQQFSNSAGEFGRFGEVRGENGVIIVAPTPHPDAETKGGEYRQIRTGTLTPLPDVLRDCLSEAQDSVDPLFDDELEDFLDTHDAAFGCGRDGCRHSIKGPVEKFQSKVTEGASRHNTMCFDALPWAFREAIAGCYSARSAFNTLREVWNDATAGEHRANEFYRVAKQAAAWADNDPGQIHDDEGPRDDGPRLWSATDLKPSASPSWLAKDRLPRSAVSLLVGDEGIGKSLLWVWIAAAITTGKPQPEFGIPARDPGRVIVVATEDDWCTTVRPRLEAAHADLKHVSVICTEPDGSGAPTFPRDVPLIGQADPTPALVVVDAWLDTVPPGLKIRDPQDARKALHPFKEVAQTSDAAVLLITHTNRDKSADARDRYGITSELRKKARMTLYAQADAEGRLIVGPEKSNASRPLTASKFVIEPVQWFTPTDENDGTVAVLRYAGASNRTAREHVYDAATGGGDDGTDDPRELWLFKHLMLAAKAEMAVRPKDAVTAAGEDQGLSRATVFRQFDALAAAGLAEAVTTGSFPKTTFWQIIGKADPE